MQKQHAFLAAFLLVASALRAQTDPGAGSWKTWFISSVKTYRLPPPASNKAELAEILAVQQNTDSATWQNILYWNAGAPGYRWQQLIAGLWMNDTSYNGALANMLLGAATYDATIAAWDTKYTYRRPRPFSADKRVEVRAPKPDSPSYPCEHSVAAGVAVTIIAHFYPEMADSVQYLAQQLMRSRIAAGVAYPGDTRAGFELGRQIAAAEIERTNNFTPKIAWDGKRPEGPAVWQGEPMLPLAGSNQTVVLDSGSQFRPGPPPDFARDMEELRNFKQTFRSTANAFFHASQPFWTDLLHKKIFEYNLNLNPPRAARLYAIAAVATYDGFTACWDAKYTYWGTRPDQYDPSFRPLLFFSPPFPGYPSGHAMLAGVFAELYAYFFPAEQAYFRKKARETAESRFQGGIHFRTDNEVALDMGKKVGEYIVRKVRNDGADAPLPRRKQSPK
ncbi:MAG: phosphatase PAP2 family protein [Saprospiraceae bacterium]|nr:phosphatase PAP2 family protein [Saprospiraceae bacterium]